MPTPILTVLEVAALLKCSRSRVFELLAAGKLVRGVSFGKATVITAASVERLQVAQVPAPPPVRKRRASVGAESIRGIPLTGPGHESGCDCVTCRPWTY